MHEEFSFKITFFFKKLSYVSLQNGHKWHRGLHRAALPHCQSSASASLIQNLLPTPPQGCQSLCSKTNARDNQILQGNTLLCSSTHIENVHHSAEEAMLCLLSECNVTSQLPDPPPAKLLWWQHLRVTHLIISRAFMLHTQWGLNGGKS